MTCESISLYPFVSASQPIPSIRVGHPRTAEQFSKAIQQYGSNTPVKIDSIAKRAAPSAEGGVPSIFIRDMGIVGLNHTYLIPHPFKIGDILDRYLLSIEFRAHLPSGSRYINHPTDSGYGCGFETEYTTQALSYMQEHDLPHAQTRSTIEGGNGYVFFGPHGDPRAIIGESSLALTLIGLERQGYFADSQESLQNLLATIHTPSDEAIRKARNMFLFARQKNLRERSVYFNQNESKMTPQEAKRYKTALDFAENNFGKHYDELLLAPLTEVDRMRYREEGRMWEAKEKLALQVISEDLDVPINNLAVVAQRDFHIDMEMFIAPNGEDVYLDEGAAQENPSVIEELQKIGCKVILVAGVHQVGADSINFMNGVFVSTPSGPLFVTNGTKGDEVSNKLRNNFMQKVSGFRVHFLNETQRLLTDLSGGIHCATREEPNYETPFDIALSYVGDPVPEKRIRECAREALARLEFK